MHIFAVSSAVARTATGRRSCLEKRPYHPHLVHCLHPQAHAPLCKARPLEATSKAARFSIRSMTWKSLVITTSVLVVIQKLAVLVGLRAYLLQHKPGHASAASAWMSCCYRDWVLPTQTAHTCCVKKAHCCRLLCSPRRSPARRPCHCHTSIVTYQSMAWHRRAFYRARHPGAASLNAQQRAHPWPTFGADTRSGCVSDANGWLNGLCRHSQGFPFRVSASVTVADGQVQRACALCLPVTPQCACCMDYEV